MISIILCPGKGTLVIHVSGSRPVRHQVVDDFVVVVSGYKIYLGESFTLKLV